MELISAFEFSKGYKFLTLDAAFPHIPSQKIVLDIITQENETAFELVIDYAQSRMVLDSGFYVIATITKSMSKNHRL